MHKPEIRLPGWQGKVKSGKTAITVDEIEKLKSSEGKNKGTAGYIKK